MTPISPSDLVIMNDLCGSEPLAIDLVYANAAHPENIFGAALYRADAPFMLHKRLAAVVVNAARNLRDWGGYTLVLRDGLRTIEAQQAVFDTPLIRAHPEWVSGPDKMFAAPGGGGHPRGMAVDVGVRGPDGQDLDFGTVFDAMPETGGANPAHRLHTDFGGAERSARVLANRNMLTQAMMDAAADAGEAVWPLRHEWWDYRLPAHIYGVYAPLSDTDLPEALRLTPKS